MLSSKHQGEWAEVRFLDQAFRRGLHVSKPYGDNTAYDFIVDSRSRLTRIQVKSVSRLDGDSFRITVSHGGGRKRGYHSHDVDLIAAYVIPCDVWYLIPVRTIAGLKSIRLCPHRFSRRRHEKYRNAWSLLSTHQKWNPNSAVRLRGVT